MPAFFLERGDVAVCIHCARGGLRGASFYLDEASVTGTETALLAAVSAQATPPDETPWDKAFWKDTLRNAMHVGQTVDSLRLSDVLRAARWLRAAGVMLHSRWAMTAAGWALGFFLGQLDFCRRASDQLSYHARSIQPSAARGACRGGDANLKSPGPTATMRAW